MVNFSKIISLCYPCSSQHHSIREFGRLKRESQLAVGLITFVVSIATFPSFGLLGVLTFRCLVKKFSASSPKQENLLGLKKIENEALNCLPRKETAAREVKPLDLKIQLPTQPNIQEKKNQPQPKQEVVTKIPAIEAQRYKHPEVQEKKDLPLDPIAQHNQEAPAKVSVLGEEKRKEEIPKHPEVQEKKDLPLDPLPQHNQEAAAKVTALGIEKKKEELYKHSEVQEKENPPLEPNIPLQVEKDEKHLNKQAVLFDAVKKGQIEIVKQILDNDDKELANAEDEDGNIPLHFAAANVNYELVKLLLLHTKNPNAQDKKFSETALIRALKNEDEKIDIDALIKIVELLIEKGADVNIANYQKYLPIHYVASRADLKLANLIVPLTKDINAQENRFQGTPLHNLVYYVGKKGLEGLETMKLFFQYGADANIEDHCKQLPLHTLWSFQEDIAEFLISKTKNLNARDMNGKTPLHFAAYKGPIEFVKLLLKHGADKTIKNNSRELPFHEAIIFKDEKMVELLLVKEEINAPTFLKQTALHLAAHKKPEILQLLIDNGADANLRDALDKLPLHEASENGFLDNVRLLLPLTKDIRAKTVFNKTPLLLAQEKGHQETVKILEEAERVF